MPDTPVEPPPGGRYPAEMESRVAVLEQIARNTVASLERIERRFDTVDRRFETLDGRYSSRFDTVDRRFDTLDRRIDGLTAEHRRDFRWLIGMMLGGFGAMLGVMAHGFHWL